MKLKLYWGRIGQAIALMIVGAFAGMANAQTVLVDFGNSNSFRGVSVPAPDAKGHFWNSLQPGVPGINMIDLNNAPTTVDLFFDTGVGTDSFNGPAGATSFPNPTPAEVAATDIDTVALGNLGIKEAAIDFAASPGDDSATTGNNTRFQLQNLDPSKKYTITFFGSHKFNNEATTAYSVFNDATYSTLIGSANLNVYTPGSPNLHNRDTVATISNLSPGGAFNDILYVQFVGATGHYGYLNSMQITAVPEPGTLLLLSGSAVAIACGFRRRR
jgi:hypothetical protein